MSKYPLCPPGYNGGFCADYYVDCKKCWAEYEEKIWVASVETSRNTSNDLLAKIVEITRKGYLVYFDDDAGSKLGFFRIKLIDCRTQKRLGRAIFLGKPTDFSTDSHTLEVIEMLDTMVKIFEEEKNESKR